MNILGLSCYFHDSSATLIQNGKIIAAVQEERFTRIKHDSRFPQNSIQFCLNQGNISFSDLDKIIFYENPKLKFDRIKKTYSLFFPKTINLFFKTFFSWGIYKSDYRKRLKNEFKKSFSVHLNKKIFENVAHHRSHAASAFYPSPFKESAILIMDGVGEFATTSIWKGKSNKIKKIFQINFPHSLGLLYSAFTYYTGFKVNSGEYKMMGLAPYGKPKYHSLIKKI